MANNRLLIAGLEEFKAQLRNLPAHLAEEAKGIVTAHALDAGVKVEAAYHQHDKTGNLSSHVKVEAAVNATNAGVSARVRSTAKHAAIFEYGSQVRHTERGANRGSMPPGHVFVPIVQRERREMVEDLIGLVQREGLTVSGHAG